MNLKNKYIYISIYIKLYLFSVLFPVKYRISVTEFLNRMCYFFIFFYLLILPITKKNANDILREIE